MFLADARRFLQKKLRASLITRAFVAKKEFCCVPDGTLIIDVFILFYPYFAPNGTNGRLLAYIQKNSTMRVKEDPNEYRTIFLQEFEPGIYRIFCGRRFFVLLRILEPSW